MTWLKRNNNFSSIADVVSFNTGMTLTELGEEKEYNINRMREVANLIHKAVRAKQKISVVADYDADGVCSAAIIRLALDAIGADSYIRIPKRMSEGYGLNPSIVDELPNDGLLITVDNGIAAFEAIKKAKEKGLTVIILDHHMLVEDSSIPMADIVVDPSAIGEADFTHYCGAGLAYKLSVELLGKRHPCVPKCLSFAAIATVADVMPLIGDNRQIVRAGLKSMLTPEGATCGLAELIKLNGLDIAINEKNLGFKIGPCINAPGRLYDDGATKSYKLLICDDEKLATKLAEEIVADNELRKKKKDEGVEVLLKNIAKNKLEGDIPLVLYEPGLEEGLVGLYAGHFAEEMRRPCIVFTSTEKGFLKGSARTYGDVHLKKLLDENSSLIFKYGGHKGAAGLSIMPENLESFRKALKKSLEGVSFPEENFYDLEIQAKDVPLEIHRLAKYAPFGEGNPEIVFKVNNFCVTPTLKGYVQTMCEGKHGKVINREKTTAICFGLGKELTETVDEKPKNLTFFGKLSMNISKYGEVCQIEADDFEIQKKEVPLTSLALRLRYAAQNKKF